MFMNVWTATLTSVLMSSQHSTTQTLINLSFVSPTTDKCCSRLFIDFGCNLITRILCFWASQEQRLRYLKLQDQRQQQQQEVSEQERLRQLRENAQNQEAKLRRVRALRGQVEQKRLSNSKLGQCDGALGDCMCVFLHFIGFLCQKSHLSVEIVAARKKKIHQQLPEVWSLGTWGRIYKDLWVCSQQQKFNIPPQKHAQNEERDKDSVCNTQTNRRENKRTKDK